jgi:hypothetical protein
MEKGES